MQVTLNFLTSRVARRLFILFVIASIIPVFVVGFLSYNYVSTHLQKQTHEYLATSGKNYGMAIFDRLLIAEDQLKRFIQFKTQDKNSQGLLDLNNESLKIYTENSTINSVSISPIPSNLSLSDVNHMNSGNTKIIITRDSENNLDVNLARMITGLSSTYMISAKIDKDYLFGEDEIFSGYEDACIVIQNLGALNCSSKEFYSHSKNYFEVSDSGSSSIFTFHDERNGYSVASWDLYLNGKYLTESWSIYYAQPLNKLFAPSNAFAKILLPSLILAILLVTWITLHQISRILVPLEKLKEVTKKIASNNFDEKVQFHSDDEFQALGDSFNVMSDELKKRQGKLHYQANYDDLTKLPNRQHLNDYINAIIKKSENENDKFAFLFIDLDRFKVINDTQGHATGDKLLVEVSHRIKNCVSGYDFLSRFGGDEFVVIMPIYGEHQRVNGAAEKIIQDLSAAFYIENYEHFIGASIGIAEFPKDGRTFEELIQKADIAMYKAKQQGRKRLVNFADSMQDDVWEKAELEADLRHAIERNELFPVFQPQLDLITGEISGAEVLLRWNHGKKGPIRPDKFIAYAEDNGYIVELGYWVIKETIRQCELWQQDYKALPKVSINISARQLRHENFIHDIESRLNDFDIHTTNVEFELTESLFLEDDPRTYSIFKEINKLGIEIAIDDFGKGYSSLSYLKKLPAQTLKIDQLFIRDLTNDEESRAIVKAIISMGKALNKKIVAEGIETIEQLNILKDLNCDYGQGYFISKPKTADELIIKSQETAIFELSKIDNRFKQA